MTIKTLVLHAAKHIGLFALMRAVTRKSPRILCYHGGNLGDERYYNPKLFCSPDQLRQRLAWLRSHGFRPTTLDEAGGLAAAAGGDIPVAVTLDDGWYSSFHDLLPLLAEYGYQPVLYLHTEAFLAGTPIVSVSVRYILWKADPGRFTLAGLTPALDGDYDLGQAEQRRLLCSRAEAWLAGLEGPAVAASLERLAGALGVPADVLDLASRRFSYMTEDELRRAAGGGCRIELHGHIHQYFRGEQERNRENIERCRAVIVGAGLPAPIHYCYPSGAFDAAAPAVMHATGVGTATTCLPGLVKHADGERRFFLPRFLDGGDVSMIEFEAEMSGVLELARTLARRRY